MKYVKVDSKYHINKCTICDFGLKSLHTLVNVGYGCYRCKQCGYLPQISELPGSEMTSVYDTQDDMLCEDCEEHSHERDTVLDELKESLVA